jgi:hypothetical protein
MREKDIADIISGDIHSGDIIYKTEQKEVKK